MKQQSFWSTRLFGRALIWWRAWGCRAGAASWAPARGARARAPARGARAAARRRAAREWWQRPPAAARRARCWWPAAGAPGSAWWRRRTWAARPPPCRSQAASAAWSRRPALRSRGLDRRSGTTDTGYVNDNHVTETAVDLPFLLRSCDRSIFYLLASLCEFVRANVNGSNGNRLDWNR